MKSRYFRLFLLVFIGVFFVLPNLICAQQKTEEIFKNSSGFALKETEVKKILLLLIGKLTQNWIDVASSADSQSEKEAVLMIVKKAASADLANYLLTNYPKEITRDSIVAAIKIAKLLMAEDISDAVGQIEKFTLEKSKEYLNILLSAEEIKINNGNIYSYYTDYNKKGQKIKLPYIAAYKDLSEKNAVVSIGIYSPKTISAPRVQVGQEWQGGIDSIPPFILRARGVVLKENSYYKWVRNPKIEVIFNEDVPDFDFKEPSFWDKIQNFVKSLNPFGRASLTDNFDSLINETESSINNKKDNSQKDSNLDISEDNNGEDLENEQNGQITEKETDNLAEIQEELDNISEKISVLSQELLDLINNSEEEKNNEEENKLTKKTNKKESLGSLSAVSYPMILITEIQTSGPLGDKDEFIELYNPNEEDVLLDGWYVQRKTKNSYTFSTFASSNVLSGKKIKANDYFLIARKDSAFSNLADIVIDNALTDDNTVALKNPDGVIMDKVGWGGANDYETAPAPNPKSGETLARKWDDSFDNYQDTGNNFNDFEIKSATPRSKNTIIVDYSDKTNSDYRDKILISEIQIADKEFIELYNTTGEDINISNFYFSYYSKDRDWNKPYRNKKFPGNSAIPSYGYYLIGLGGYIQDNSNPNSDWHPYTTGQLSNSSGAAAVFSYNPESAKSSDEAESLKIDAVGWGSALVKETEASSPPKAGKSLARKQNQASRIYQETDNNKNDFEEGEPSPQNSKTGKFFPEIQNQDFPWQTFGHDFQHTGRSGNAGPVSGIEKEWEYELATDVDSRCFYAASQPIIKKEGEIYFGMGEAGCNGKDPWGKVYAINSDGSLKWESPDLKSPVTGITISPDFIYASTKTSGLFAINPDGSESWNFYEEGMADISNIAIDLSDSIYFSDGNKIYCLDSLGAKKWESSAPSGRIPAPGGPAIGQNGVIYATWIGFKDFSTGKLTAYDKESGEVKWSSDLRYASSAPAVGANGDIYVATGEGNYFGTLRSLFAFSPDGIKKWESESQYGSVFTPLISSSGEIIIADGWDRVAGQSWGSYVWQSMSQITFFSPGGEVIKTIGPTESQRITGQPVIGASNMIFAPQRIFETSQEFGMYAELKSSLYLYDITGPKWFFDVAGSFASSISIGKNNNIYAAISEPVLGENQTNRIKIYSFRPGIITPPDIELQLKTENNKIEESVLPASSDDIFLQSSDDIFE